MTRLHRLQRAVAWWGPACLPLAVACDDGLSGTPGAIGGSGGDDTGEEVLPDPGGLLLGGIVTCEDPSARAQLPMDLLAHAGDWNGPDLGAGLGVTVADLTGDGILDILLPNYNMPHQFMVGQADGTFLEQGERLDFDQVLHVNLATAVDLDGDGDLDLVWGCDEGPDTVMLNDGKGWFEDVTEDLGWPQVLGQTTVLAFGDMDGDEDLDLFVGLDRTSDSGPRTPMSNLLLENTGGGVMVDVSERLTSDQREGYTKAGGWHDFDMDGDTDLYIINHRPTSEIGNFLLLNAGAEGDWELVSAPEAGLDVLMSGMSLGIGDFDGDQGMDLVVSDRERLWLFQSLPGMSGSWYESSFARGVVCDESIDRVSGWGAELVDLDNDGRLDIPMAFSPMNFMTEPGENPTEQPDALWLQQEDGNFVDYAEAWGLADTSDTKGLAVIDVNRDGWLDILKRNNGTAPRLYLSRCGEEAWLNVQIAGRAPNTRGIGVKVSVTVGERTITHWASAGSTSLHTSLQPEVHFGLGDAEVVDKLTVTWADGSTSTWHGIEPRQFVTIVEDEARQ